MPKQEMTIYPLCTSPDELGGTAMDVSRRAPHPPTWAPTIDLVTQDGVHRATYVSAALVLGLPDACEDCAHRPRASHCLLCRRVRELKARCA